VAKTIGMVVLAAVLTAFLSTAIQQLMWHRTNVGVSGGAAAGVAVAVAMSRRKRPPGQIAP
jgi:hypothetical protein